MSHWHPSHEIVMVSMNATQKIIEPVILGSHPEREDSLFKSIKWKDGE
jgi:hypothetical protein